MAPKKSKARESSSQPVPEPRPQARRNGKKRSYSDSSNVSDRPSSSQSTPSGPKRRKRTRATPDDVIVEEEEETVEVMDDDAELPACETEIDVIQTDGTPSDRHVRFGQATAGAQLEDVSEDELEKATATHITPHPRKMTIKRRATASPSVRFSDGSKRVKVTTSRTSLPATLVPDGVDPFYVLEEHHFAPLREVIRERVRRRQILHSGKAERLHDLELELETQSRLGNVERVQELQEGIALARKEYKRVLTDGDVVEVLDEDMLVLDGEEAVTYPQLPAPAPAHAESWRYESDAKLLESSTGHTDRLLAESQSERESWNSERRKFEDAIVALSREANEAKTDLQILKIELLALGFESGSGEVSISTVLLSIRESFSRIRQGMELVLPGSLPEAVSNQNLIEILLANIKDFTERLHTQDRELQQKITLISDLGQQVHGLVDHLAEAQIRNEKLEQGWSELDQSNEDKARKLGNVEDELFKTEEERDALDADLNVKTEEVHDLQQENVELSTSLQRLTDSLQQYRNEETRLTELISRMEEEHQATVSKMNQEREDTVRQLEDQIDRHADGRKTAELLAEERQAIIIGLELRVETIEGERDALQIDLQEVRLRHEEEQGARETAEAELDEKSAEVQDLEGRVDRLEKELTRLNDQLGELRQLNEAERLQREGAETDLDERNADVEELNQRLREQGVQANELRQKLFEVQQRNSEKLRELEQVASEREEQYQVDIATEVDRREAADALARQHADTTAGLEIRLEKLEIEMRDVIVLRDERIAVLEAEVVEKNSEIVALRRDVQTLEDNYQHHVSSSTLQREELERQIVQLTLIIAERESALATLRADAARTVSLHDSEMDDRNAHIAGLNHRVAALQTEVSDLTGTKADLERRAADEAAALLQAQTASRAEVARLQAALREKQDKILRVEEKVLATDRSWQEVLTARDVEIAALTTTAQTTTETLSSVSADLFALKRKFREYVRRSTGRMSALREALAHARAAVDGEVEAVAADGAVMLEEIEAMAEYGEIAVSSSQQTVSNSQTTMVTATTNGSSSAAGKKATRGRRRRVMDSGIGMEMDGEADGEGN